MKTNVTVLVNADWIFLLEIDSCHDATQRHNGRIMLGRVCRFVNTTFKLPAPPLQSSPLNIYYYHQDTWEEAHDEAGSSAV